MMKLFLILSLIFTFGCASTNQQTPYNTIGGGLLGGIAGGIAGNQIGDGTGKIVATIAGTILGVGLGSYIGSYMDRSDLKNTNQSLETLPTNTTSNWKNPDTGNNFQITPVNTYQTNNTYCREYISNAIINREEVTIYGTACRQPDGSWKIIKEERM